MTFSVLLHNARRLMDLTFVRDDSTNDWRNGTKIRGPIYKHYMDFPDWSRYVGAQQNGRKSDFQIGMLM